jgi:AcrR family transcriptional regulator
MLRAALECFAELGYDATRVRHIAERAGVSDAALYRHFPSMEALGQELHDRYYRAYVAQLQEATSVGSTEERLRQAVRATLAFYRAEPAAFTFAVLRLHTFAPQLPDGTVHAVDVLEEVIAAGQRRHELRSAQPLLLTGIFFGCVLRPIILATLAGADALDLLTESKHDRVIEDAALAAVRKNQAPSSRRARP